MVECVFTIDYEIYGDGRGSLKELVYEPARRLKAMFDQAGAKLVVFVEAAELEKIDEFRTDPAIDDVKQQIRSFYEDGHEIALHIHPQWYNARYEDGVWNLDYDEYSLGLLSEQRIDAIVGRAIAYLRGVLDDSDFTPLSFRAGNWLFQPTAKIARVLARHGVKIDSSVFKGGRQRKHGLDYRRAGRNGYYWNFSDDVNVADPGGPLLEIPVYTRMVPFWKMVTGKRLGLQAKAHSGGKPMRDRFERLLDLARFRHPLKFDFCRMTLSELEETIEMASHADQAEPHARRPIVAIGHTKDLEDFETIHAFLSYLQRKSIGVTMFQEMKSGHQLNKVASEPVPPDLKAGHKSYLP
jgi:peptidoglycan/xylan/chitin deacetylase (PgdA/CDA1 family)